MSLYRELQRALSLTEGSRVGWLLSSMTAPSSITHAHCCFALAVLTQHRERGALELARRSHITLAHCAAAAVAADGEKILSRILCLSMCTAAFHASKGVLPAARLSFRGLSGPAARWTVSGLIDGLYQVPVGRKSSASRCLSVKPSGQKVSQCQWQSAAAWHQPCVSLRRIPPGSYSLSPCVRCYTVSASGSETLGQTTELGDVSGKEVTDSLGDNGDAEIEEGVGDEEAEKELVELTEEGQHPCLDIVSCQMHDPLLDADFLQTCSAIRPW